MVPVPVPTFEKLWFRFRFRFLLLKSYGSGSGSAPYPDHKNFLTSYGSDSGSTSLQVTVPTVPVPVPQRCPPRKHSRLTKGSSQIAGEELPNGVVEMLLLPLEYGGDHVVHQRKRKVHIRLQQHHHVGETTDTNPS